MSTPYLQPTLTCTLTPHGCGALNLMKVMVRWLLLAALVYAGGLREESEGS